MVSCSDSSSLLPKDDILVYSKKFKDQLKITRLTLRGEREKDVRMKESERMLFHCMLFQSQVAFLGHVSANGYRLNLAHLLSVKL